MPVGAEWIAWIEENLQLGVPVGSISNTMRERGYDSASIITALGEAQRNLAAREGAQTVEFEDVARQVTAAGAVPVKTDKAEIYVFKKFLSPADCKRLIEVMRPHLRPSTVVRQEEVGNIYRTSKSCDLVHLKDPWLKEVDKRIAAALGLSPRLAEGTQAQYYDVGEEYKSHHDYFLGDDLENYDGPRRGQRTYTFMIYLNTVREGGGGETRFKHLDLDFHPRAGTAVIWNNLHADRQVNPMTEHQAMPVKKGHKAIITKWFRSKIDLG